MSPGLLVYLAKAEGDVGRLMGLLEALHDRQPGGWIEHAPGLLERMDVELRGIDASQVREAVKLYGG